MAYKFKSHVTLSILLFFICFKTTPSYAGDEEEAVVAVDEKDVVVLKESNFSEFIEKNKYVMVEFYAPWCGHCKTLAPEYAAAATVLKGEGVVLAKVDATEEKELGKRYGVEGFPTVFFFVDGVHKLYNGDRTKDAIIAWVKKTTGPRLFNVTTIEQGEKILAAGKPVVFGYLNALVGSESDELSAASKLEDDIEFYQTASSDVAKLFHINPEFKRPALVVIKKEAEKISHFGGEFTRSDIAEFVFVNKLPLVINFTAETASRVLENPINKKIILFATSTDSEKFLPLFREAAKDYKGKVIFVYLELDNEEIGQAVAEYFGVSEDTPSVLACAGNNDERKYLLYGEISLSNVKSFGEKFLEDKLKLFYKSDPIPEKNDGDVKTVVGNNFDEIVLDESKDVLLEIYAPWCRYCMEMEPTYNELAKQLRGVDSLVIAKMDGSKNDHPRAAAEAYPTILFFPAGKKSSDPIDVEPDQTVVTFYGFLKKHATIPFKIVNDLEVSESYENENSDLKDEL